MPLLPGKKNIGRNVKMEESHGKSKPQSLAIAMNVARKKKMASGGMVKDSAKMESRPMPTEVAKDSMQVSLNSGNKAPKNDSWTDRSTVAQAQKPSKTPLSRPKIAKGSTFSSIDRDLVDQEERLQSAMPPSEPTDEPKSEYNEEDAKKMGKSPDMSKPHSAPKSYFEGGAVSQKESEEDEVVHPEGLESDDDEMSPAHDEYMAGKAQMLADGGMAEMDDQPSHEAEMEHHDSLAAAIMAKRGMKMLAEGGEVDIDSNNEEQPNGYYDRNEHAALKENFDSDMDDVSQPMDSNEMGDEREASSENKRDMLSEIRSRMKRKLR